LEQELADPETMRGLDALQVVAPGALESILENAIRSLIYEHVWAVEAEYERSERKLLSQIAANERRGNS
jgi:hypothetical protein